MRKILQSFIFLTLFIHTTMHANNSCCATCPDCCYSSSCYSDCNDCCLGPCDGYPFLAYRSQSRNAARELVGWQQFINRCDTECTYGAFYLALEYTRSFRPEHLARHFFGCDLDNCNTLLVQGSQVEARNEKAWLADYFGLSPKFDSRVSFCPRIQNVIIDMHFHLGLDEWAQGLFFNIAAPIAWTKWELNMCECIKDDGTGDGGTGFMAGYMSDDTIARNKLANSFTESMSGTVVFGDMKEAIKFGRMTNCELTKVRIADIRASFGYNFTLKEKSHAGVFLHIAAPTGNRPKSCYLFEPMVGNGKHWELGIGFTGSYVFWESKEYDERYMGVWVDATLSHLFKDCQCRSFDLCCKPNSRYMLLAQMGPNTDPKLFAGEEEPGTEVKYRYQKNLIPAINWSTFNVDVKIDIQADIAIKLGYVRENWSFDLGYNLWARTGEKFCIDCCDCYDDCCYDCEASCVCPSDKYYAIKGDAFIYGYDHTAAPVASALSATQCKANIHSGKNYPPQTTDTLVPAQNPRIDNPSNAIGLSDFENTGPAINTSHPAILVKKSMLNLGKGPNAITHKIFAHFGYAWTDREDDWIPFVGAGFEVEFAQKGDCCYDNCCDGCCSCNNCCNTCCDIPCVTGCNTSCDTCYNTCNSSKRAGVYQYGLWFKGGLSFD